MSKIESDICPEVPQTAPADQAMPRSGIRRVLVRDLVLAAEIGVLRSERGLRQRVRINLDLAVRQEERPTEDDLRNVVCYDEIVSGVRAIVGAGHVKLVETLAERIAAMCLGDIRIISARVRVEKLDAYADVAAVGVEIERWNPAAAHVPRS